MVRGWRNGFVLFVILLIFATLWKTTAPGLSLRRSIHTTNSNQTKSSDVRQHEFLKFKQLSNHFHAVHWERAGEEAIHDSDWFSLCKPSIDDSNPLNTFSKANQFTRLWNSIELPNSLQPHGPITIESDADFASQGWPGNGSLENPYTLTNLSITNQGLHYCVRIINTQVHFVISNCWMNGSSFPSADFGVYLENVTNAFIANTTIMNVDSGVTLLVSDSNDLINNTCIELRTGMYVSGSSSNHIINNNFTRTGYGIQVQYSSSNWISDNTFYDDNSFCIEGYATQDMKVINNTCEETSKGIRILESNATIISFNTCKDTRQTGIELFDSSATELINNTCIDNGSFGCEIYPVNDNIIANNSLVGCGFFFGSWDRVGATPTMCGVGSIGDAATQITGNSVNQLPLILWIGRVGGRVPLGGGQVILLNCSLIIVQDQNLANASIGVFLCFTTRTSVFNNTCTGHSVDGIRIRNCNEIIVKNNLCTNNSVSGITTDQTIDATLTGNTCIYNTWGNGIHLFESYDHQIYNNTCNYNTYGIHLGPAFGTQLLNNTCNHNLVQSWLWFSGAGIWVDGDANTVSRNHCNGNWQGISISGSENYVLENTCTDNSYGITLGSDTTPIANNLIVNNIFGIYVNSYRDIIITDNTLVSCGLYIEYRGREWIAEVDTSGNTVNGYPLIFFKDRANIRIGLKAGQIILFNCREITVMRQTLMDCSAGLLVYNTNYSLFADNDLGDNTRYGIVAYDSHNNHFTRNLFTTNAYEGVYLDSSCQCNIFDWNIFLCNASYDARDYGPEFQDPSANIFDRNYWANYTGYDLNFDGYGDIPYNISGMAYNRDLHPLMMPYIVLAMRLVEQLHILLEGVVILAIVVAVFVLIRLKIRKDSSL